MTAPGTGPAETVSPAAAVVHPGPGTPAGPAVPPGPGVLPPFAAPPSDRNMKALWIGLGVGALVLVICCVGGVFGAAVLGRNVSNQLEQEARKVATAYLDGWRSRNYPRAYDQLCDAKKRELSRAQFSSSLRSRPLNSYEINDVKPNATPVTVRAAVRYANGLSETLTMELEQRSSSSTELLICNVR